MDRLKFFAWDLHSNRCTVDRPASDCLSHWMGMAWPQVRGCVDAYIRLTVCLGSVDQFQGLYILTYVLLSVSDQTMSIVHRCQVSPWKSSCAP